jgi:ABC-type sugar transport system permease subunit/ABC-type glycerol-3-phosphate transport system substrate-binding protein
MARNSLFFGAWLMAALVLLAALPATAQAPRRVIHLATMSANYRVALEEIERRYEKLHPDTDVKITLIGQGYETWIRAMYAAGGDLVPDLYHVNYTIGAWEEGKIVFLNEFLEETSPYTGQPWIDGLDRPMVERYKWAGRVFSIPLDYIDIGIFYNKEIFAEAGVEPPATWDEWLDVSQRIREAGYVPIAMSGDFDAFWSGTMGWLYRLLGDVYLRDHVPLVMSRPGDWDYDPDRNDGFVYDPDDPYSDLFVVMNNERLLAAVRDRKVDFKGPKFAAIQRRLDEISEHFQAGFMGSAEARGSALNMFYRQKAAMVFLTTGHVTGIERDFRRLDPEDRFDYGTFWFPEITGDPLACGPFRGVGGAGTQLGITDKKDPEHTRRVVDFFMYLTSPEAGQLLVDLTVAADQPLVGPPVIQSVTLPPHLADKYEVFQGHGYEKLNFRGVLDEQESVAEWVVLSQEYFAGRLTLEEYLDRYYESVLRAIPRLQERYGYDFDPATEDEPPVHTARKNPWNPFQNGTLAVALIMACFAAFGAWHVFRARGAMRVSTITAYLLLLPTFFLMGTFLYFPALSGLYHAFTEWEGGRGVAVFNGLENFRTLATDRVFWRGALNMAALTLAGLFKATVVPFIAAEMIIAIASPRLKYLMRTAFLLPMVVPGMVGILIWQFIYDPSMGLLNQFLALVGLGALQSSWLGEPHLALPSIIFMGFPWIGALGLLIYMAGLLTVPSSVYEAYQLESESILKRIRAIDIPMVRGQTRLLVVLTFIGSLQDFQTVLIMTGGGPGLSTMVPALRMYHVAFRFGHYGYGAAMGFVLFLSILIVTIVNMRVMRRAETE